MYFVLAIMIPAFISFITTILAALLGIAFYTLLERKLLGYSQSRVGPNKVSISGVPQPLADALKLFTKETRAPTLSNASPFTVRPLLRLIIALILWSISPHPAQRVFVPIGIVLFLTISRVSVYTTMGAGWSSNSKYALLGALRSVAQTISYEVSISLLLLAALLALWSFDFFISLTSSFLPVIIIITPVALTWLFTCVAETNRAPFDFAEGERELVSGFNTEYRAGKFALIFIAEYARILVICLFSAALFLQLGLIPFPLNAIALVSGTSLLAVIFVITRSSYPRLRYDLLIHLTWKSILPLSLVALIVVTPILNIL